ncbi:acetolactate synthase 3 large subunit, partial [Rhizobium ruizarguesonis]
ECDLMVAIGARFDDLAISRVHEFSPHSKKIQIDIDASSINKRVLVDIGVQGDAAHVLAGMIHAWRSLSTVPDQKRLRA